MTRHEKLFDLYRKNLLAAKQDVEAWWADLLASEQKITGSAEAAKKAVSRRWPAGPAAHPRVVWIVRATFLACLELNEESDDEVEPHILMTEWLLDGQSDDLIPFLAQLSYWPIGFDEDGEEC